MSASTAAAATPHRYARRGVGVLLRYREASILIVAILLMSYFALSSSNFLTERNLLVISHILAPIAILAAGEVLLLVSGEIDLSVGHVYALAPFLMHELVFYYDVPALLAILIAVGAGTTIGAINGLVTVKIGIPSFITTLGMLNLLHGLTLMISNAYPARIPEATRGLQSWLGGSPWSLMIWALLIVLIIQFLFSQTRWGLHTIAAGGNPLGAAEAGVPVHRVKVGNFMITSTLGALTGIMSGFRIDSIEPLAGGTTIMFAAVAAAVIGGTALAGGSGTVIGAAVGALVLAVLRNGFTLIGINADRFFLVVGIAILIAMVLNVYLARARTAGRLR
jgi:simple sugar transport system permease protein